MKFAGEKMQKKIFLILFFIICVQNEYILGEEKQNKKQIKVLIEGVEDIKEHQEAKPYIIWERYDKKGEEQRLKDIAIKSNIESEILDALINKIVDLEDNVKKMKILNIINFWISFIFLIIIIYLIIKKKIVNDKKYQHNNF